MWSAVITIPEAQVRQVPELAGYSASICGKIIQHAWSGPAKEKGKIVTRNYPARILSPCAGRVRLKGPEGKLYPVRVCRLVARTWIDRKLTEKDKVEFIDGDRKNSAASNLRVVRTLRESVTLAGKTREVIE